MEKIISITEHQTGAMYCNKEGYKIITDKQEITMLIDAEQSCCESWGYLMSQDDFSDFIGAQLIDIKLVDELMNARGIEELQNSEDVYTVFVNIYTSSGVLQFVAYNAHNGYYGHGVEIKSIQLTHETTL
jgi:hypothetical protein